MDRILEMPVFEQALAKASDDQRKQLDLILTSGNSVGLRLWIKETLSCPLHLKSYREIRDMARNENIPNYSRKSKNQLIKDLQNAASMGECRTTAQ
jgi:hypothetical protein